MEQSIEPVQKQVRQQRRYYAPLATSETACLNLLATGNDEWVTLTTGEDAWATLSLRPPDHWRSTQVSLIQDKLTIPAIDRVKGAGQAG